MNATFLTTYVRISAPSLRTNLMGAPNEVHLSHGVCKDVPQRRLSLIHACRAASLFVFDLVGALP